MWGPRIDRVRGPSWVELLAECVFENDGVGWAALGGAADGLCIRACGIEQADAAAIIQPEHGRSGGNAVRGANAGAAVNNDA